MKIPANMHCTAHQLPLTLQQEQGEACLVCTSSCKFPVIRKIPRFVEHELYASAFGYQWNVFRQTQLDSYMQIPYNKNRLAEYFGGSLEFVRNKSILEAGCGAGRFTEVLLETGARVFACDVSSAVEANYANCNKYENYFVCQADLRHIPVLPGQFDIVLCLGVIQHTPDPEQTIARLAEYVKPGGLLIFDHYRGFRDVPGSQRLHRKILNALKPAKMLRPILLRLSPEQAFMLVKSIFYTLLPIHTVFWREGPVITKLRKFWSKISPIADKYGYDPYLFSHLDWQKLTAWMLLDTYDGLTDYYKHGREVNEIEAYLKSIGMITIETRLGGNGVLARAVKPE